MIAYKLQLKIIVMPLITMIIMISGAVSGGPGLPGMGWKGAVVSRERLRSGDSEMKMLASWRHESLPSPSLPEHSAQSTAELALNSSEKSPNRNGEELGS